jgi:hypothetical protein
MFLHQKNALDTLPSARTHSMDAHPLALTQRSTHALHTRCTQAPLASVHATALEAVAPLFRSLADVLESRMTDMHAHYAAHWGGAAGAQQEHQRQAEGMMDTSRFVAEVAAALGAFRCVILCAACCLHVGVKHACALVVIANHNSLLDKHQPTDPKTGLTTCLASPRPPLPPPPLPPPPRPPPPCASARPGACSPSSCVTQRCCGRCPVTPSCSWQRTWRSCRRRSGRRCGRWRRRD